jgi:hypothetical protein
MEEAVQMQMLRRKRRHGLGGRPLSRKSSQHRGIAIQAIPKLVLAET